MNENIRYNENLKYIINDELLLNEFVNYIARRTSKLHDFSRLEQTIYVYDLLRNYVDESIPNISNINNLKIYIKDNKISSLSLPYIYSMVLNKISIKSKFYYVFNNDNYYLGRNIILLNDDKYNIHGVYINSIEYKDNIIVDNGNPYLNFYKTPLTLNSNAKDYYFDGHDMWFEMTILKLLAKKGLNGIKFLKEEQIELLNKISLFIENKSVFPNYGYLPKNKFIKDVLIYSDYFEILDSVEKSYSMMHNVISADMLLTALNYVRQVEYIENINIEFSTELFVKIVKENNLMFERDSEYELYNLDSSCFNIKRLSTVNDYINENNVENEFKELKKFNKR